MPQSIKASFLELALRSISVWRYFLKIRDRSFASSSDVKLIIIVSSCLQKTSCKNL